MSSPRCWRRRSSHAASRSKTAVAGTRLASTRMRTRATKCTWGSRSRRIRGVTPLSGDGLQRITDVTVSRTTRSGRVGELRIVFERGDVRIPGPDVRSVLRPEADRMLASAAFQLTVTKTNGEVTRLVAAGAGSGHAVGMCQWGAIGRARAGQDYRKILTTYFPGTKIEKVY